MVASQSTGPKVLIMGATGAQGGSVLTHLLASDKPYQLAALTRDPSKPNAKEIEQKGVEVVKGDTADVKSLEEAFKGREVVFGLTNFWSHMSYDKEVAEGRSIVDAAKAAGVKTLVWSGLENAKEVSGGKVAGVEHFDSKSEVTKYARSIGGLKVLNVEPGCYMTNFLGGAMGPRRSSSGNSDEVLFSFPMRPEGKIALLATKEDYGAYVRAALEDEKLSKDGGEVLAASDELSVEEMVKQWSEVTGHKARFVQQSDADYLSNFPGNYAKAGEELLEMLRWFDGYGYYGGKSIEPSQRILKGKVHSWRDWCKAQQWQV
ncbi:hypothetical protein NBRC10513v2_005191 [Rhodotorula toruloides]|uniref:BY PROTMAP: gi/472581969/gb/EMS19677.1/ NmrA family transcriptional regulator [Rhodosporidium toruloides NP11] gi/647395016/emb/CDR36252.1/ RHTO0S01e17568g1_1 [Rhodosporidium toruloides] n=1 Tax=Rhodotorula toruloides TaxID=5286 RepID=A0A0K3C8J1_RHOTO|nr:NAD(P)-binding protein [Rhodotorula toruloides]